MFFFVDLGCTTKDDESIASLLELASTATVMKWHVVVSTSSGGGWRNPYNTALRERIARYLNRMSSQYSLLASTNLTNKEAKTFIDVFKIDINRLEKDIEMANNPRILYTFTYTTTEYENGNDKYGSSMNNFQQYMRKLVRELLSALDDKVYNRSLKNCVEWLEYARHNVPLESHNVATYKKSYLHQENMTTCIEDGNEHKIKMHIPSMYSYLIGELKQKFHQRESDVYNLPIVRGYIFEEAFLQFECLHSLSIKALNVDNKSPCSFRFSSLTPAVAQRTGAVTTSLVENQIYHLRAKHPAIDGVCVAEEDQSEKYLLLLQVSLNTYKQHLSKGNDIKKSVESLEEQFGRMSIAGYYQKLGGDIGDDKVIYVYVSPKETKSDPNDITFMSELKNPGTKGAASSQPAYWYGFTDSKMEITIKQIEDTM